MRKTEIALLFLLWGTFAYFHHQEPGWNVNSRLGLTYAIVDFHTVRIDRYYRQPEVGTQDAAKFGGHIYSDKVIGTSLLGVPVYQVLRWGEEISGRNLSMAMRRYIITVFTVGLLAALSGVLLFRLLLLQGGNGNPLGPLVLSVLTFLGTQIFFYSTLFMAYTPAIFFLIWALERFERWRLAQGQSQEKQPIVAPPLFSCGLLLGLSMLCELTVGMAAALWGLYILAQINRKVEIWKLAAGTVLGISPFIIYSYVIFGHAAIPYQYELTPVFSHYMARGLMGATVPRLPILALITILPYRGLFVHSPYLILAIPGLWAMFANPTSRKLAAYILVAVIWYLLFNSAYFLWWGGWSFGPRHLIFIIPLLAIPALWAWQSRTARIALLTLGAMAVALHLIVNTVDPQTHDVGPTLSFMQLFNADLSTRLEWRFPSEVLPSFLKGTIDANGGMLFGLRGAATLIPLLLFWGAMGWYLYRKAPTEFQATPFDSSPASLEASSRKSRRISRRNKP